MAISYTAIAAKEKEKVLQGGGGRAMKLNA